MSENSIAALEAEFTAAQRNYFAALAKHAALALAKVADGDDAEKGAQQQSPFPSSR
jgi:hypothetical protein